MPDLRKIIGETPTGFGTTLRQHLAHDGIDMFADCMISAVDDRVVAALTSDEAVEAGARVYAEAAHWAWACTSSDKTWCADCDCIRGWLMRDTIEEARAELIERQRAALQAAANLPDLPTEENATATPELVK